MHSRFARSVGNAGRCIRTLLNLYEVVGTACEDEPIEHVTAKLPYAVALPEDLMYRESIRREFVELARTWLRGAADVSPMETHTVVQDYLQVSG